MSHVERPTETKTGLARPWKKKCILSLGKNRVTNFFRRQLTALLERENFYEEGYDRGAFIVVTNQRDRPVNGETRERTSRGSRVSGQLLQGVMGGAGRGESAGESRIECRPAGGTVALGEILASSLSVLVRHLTTAYRSGWRV